MSNIYKVGGIKMYDINDVCDYIIVNLSEGGSLNVLKLHKLLYYVQAWSLTFSGQRAFDDDFQAWVHGPVNRSIYDRFSNETTMYSNLNNQHIREGFNPETLPSDLKSKIDGVLEIYAPFAGYQLEQMTHQELPWINAREGVPSSERSENVISDEDMITCYSSRIR